MNIYCYSFRPQLSKNCMLPSTLRYMSFATNLAYYSAHYCILSMHVTMQSLIIVIMYLFLLSNFCRVIHQQYKCKSSTLRSISALSYRCKLFIYIACELLCKNLCSIPIGQSHQCDSIILHQTRA